MSLSGRLQTELIDDDVVYATGNDVFTHIRNKRFPDLDTSVDETDDLGTATSLTQSQVVDLIARFTEQVDNDTKRAWRTRRVNEYNVRVKFSHDQKRGRHRRRNRRGGTRAVNHHAGRRGMADLPHNHIRAIDSAESDKVEVLNPRSVDDVTDEQGRDNGKYVVEKRNGVIRPDTTLFVPAGRNMAGSRDIENAKLRVTYRYGEEPNPNTVDDLTGSYKVSTSVPGDIRDAVALFTAARLIGSDQYGELTPSGGGGDGPSLSEAVSSWKAEAQDTVDRFARP